MRDWNWKKVLLLAWAVLLVFGLVYQAEVAEAAHSSCGPTCTEECAGSGGCGVSMNMGCGCSWVCNDGSTGRTICT